MTTTLHPPLTMPSLRGSFGDWIYYSCLMSVSDVATRVDYAAEIHPSKELSALIQRSLEGDRAKRIADYLRNTDERFFNSLVLATYDGSPEWYDVGNLSSSKNAAILKEMTDGAVDTIGLLRLTGDERIFALDGQHRLAGMKLAISQGQDVGDELVSVILVGHSLDTAGSRRTRRLFTTLNKTAIPVKKKDIIALDEDDVMAITARRMVEQDAAFRHPKIAVISGEAMPSTNTESLITISALYDLLKLLFLHKDGVRSDYSLRFNRPDDDALDEYHAYATAIFNALGRTFPPVASLMRAKSPATVVRQNRTADGGHILFRAIGLDIFVRTAIAISARDGVTLPVAIGRLSVLPTQLSDVPFRGTIWNPSRRTVDAKHKALARRLVFHLLRLPMSPRQRQTLEGDYRVALGHQRDDAKIKLPAPLVQ
ncbi:DNA sulfur modification protein DndB [uncultured Sphingomonas sp.]|uniref:DGQHR domain-containing protein n=1 Tax=uncultured Sphingomonas sp. TaxID=158754 RepID=UPI0025EFBF09|nr:DNA sulfur modification protein DndB [uncultured Sphingomonas sp.]